jgi:hypothetical protein
MLMVISQSFMVSDDDAANTKRRSLKSIVPEK